MSAEKKDKTPAKKAVKKVAPKKVAKKAPVKKTEAPKPKVDKAPAKKAAKKTPVKKAPVKKTAVKTPVKKSVTKAAPKKAVVKKVVKKAISNKITKETSQTTLIARVDVGYGNILFIRGEGAGLSWDEGNTMECVSNDEWKFTTTASDKEITFKYLINDIDWAQGDDLTVKKGQTSVSTPQF